MQELLNTIKSMNTNDISKEALFSMIEETFNEVMNGDITKESISELFLIFKEPSQTLSVSSEKEQKKIFNETIILNNIAGWLCVIACARLNCLSMYLGL